ncbi:MAG: RagB/SusD family nutrient uptake outer membrane protein [Dysgonamonadaceae bacterium]
MKKNILYLAVLLLLTFSYSCNDDFMERLPETDITDAQFWKTKEHLQIALNALYNDYIKGHGLGFDSGSPAYPPFGNTHSHLGFNDFWTDNGMRSGVNPLDRLTSKFIRPASGVTTGWTWTELRKVNYFLTHYHVAKITQEEKNACAAEAKFFKAWDYYKKVLYFGDVPWLTKDLNETSEELYKPRDSRAMVVDSIMDCLNFAVTWLEDKSVPAPTGRLTRDMALFLKARFCLFEGTFRKYHTELNLPNANFYLEEAVKASQTLIDGKRYALYTKEMAGVNNPYWKLFTLLNNEGQKNPEIILAKEYSTTLSHGTAFQRYWNANSVWYSMCATKGFVDDYLCIDGRPIYIGGSEGNYVYNPLFKGWNGIMEELDNRDPRLTQTICKPGEYKTIYGSDGTSDIKQNGITYPLTAYGGALQTGYRVIKHWMGNYEQQELAANSAQVAIEFRYAEALLIYAEAKCELGTINQSDLDNTINRLRERAGFDFTTYPASKLTIGSEPVDPRLDKIYSEKLSTPITPLLREIRRERRVEMAFEDRRYEDLIRWKAGGLYSVPLRGTNFNAKMKKLHDGSVQGAVNPVSGYKEYASKLIVGTDVFIDSEGFIIGYPKSSDITNGTLPWNDRRYFLPIPKDQLTLNPALSQPEWNE